MVLIIKATEQLNCITTKTFLDSEAPLPARNVPFKTFIGLNDER